MDDPAGIILDIAILLILILINAFFAMSEIAIISLNDNKMRKMAEEGHKGAAKVLKLTADSSRFLSTIQIGVTLAGFLASAAASENFSEPLSRQLAEWFNITSQAGLNALSVISLIVVTLITSYFSLVLGELAPKRIAMQRSEAVSFKVVGALLFIKTLCAPFVKLLSASTNLVVRILGFDPNAAEESVTEEEIRLMVDAGEETGAIEESEKEMINNIFEFDDIAACDVMTHRTDIEAVEINDPVADIIDTAMEHGYSRIPVFEEDLDNIKGIIYIKDLLKYIGKTLPKTLKISSLMREAYFVPESKRCSDLFEEMTEKRLQMVIVADEYGGVAGLVTMEDLLESIVGSMQDEYDQEDEEVEQVNETTFDIDGVTDIEEVNELLDIQLPEGEYDTIAGFIMSEIGRIPSPEETVAVEAEGYRFTVTEMDERRIERVRAERIEPSEAPAEAEAQSKPSNEKAK